MISTLYTLYKKVSDIISDTRKKIYENFKTRTCLVLQFPLKLKRGNKLAKNQRQFYFVDHFQFKIRYQFYT